MDKTERESLVDRTVTLKRGDLSGPENRLLTALLRFTIARRKKITAYYDSYGAYKASPYREAMVSVYRIYQASEDWKRNRRETLEQASKRCQRCEGKGIATVAHHTSYDNWANGDLELPELQAVSESCHNKAHHEGIIVPFFAQ